MPQIAAELNRKWVFFHTGRAVPEFGKSFGIGPRPLSPPQNRGVTHLYWTAVPYWRRSDLAPGKRSFIWRHH